MFSLKNEVPQTSLTYIRFYGRRNCDSYQCYSEVCINGELHITEDRFPLSGLVSKNNFLDVIAVYVCSATALRPQLKPRVSGERSCGELLGGGQLADVNTYAAFTFTSILNVPRIVTAFGWSVQSSPEEAPQGPRWLWAMRWRRRLQCENGLP